MSNYIPSIFDRIWRAVVLVSVGIVTVSIGVWSFDNEPPLTIRKVSLEKSMVDPGGFLRIDYEIEPHRQCNGDLQRFIVDGLNVIHFIEPYSFSRSNSTDLPKGVQHVRISVPVPLAASPGVGKYQANIRYFCNPLQTVLDRPIEIQTPAVEFTISGSLAPAILRERTDGELLLGQPFIRTGALPGVKTAEYIPDLATGRDAFPVCAAGYTPVRPYIRRVAGRMIYVPEHCRRLRRASG